MAHMNLVGQRYGKLVVESEAGKRGSNPMWNVRCDCGSLTQKSTHNLRQDKITQCGCLSKNKKQNILGVRFGRLVVLRETSEFIGKYRLWECVCDCGKDTKATSKHLRNGLTKSCGCLRKEIVSALKKTHGMSGTPEYWVRHQILQRCTNPKDKKYPDYGGRGIKVCDRWLESFENFHNDMGVRPSDRHSVHRIDNDGNYEPSNCRWATAKEQARNTRRSLFLTHNGITATLAEWSERTGIKYGTLLRRIKSGLSMAQALNKQSERRLA